MNKFKFFNLILIIVLILLGNGNVYAYYDEYVSAIDPYDQNYWCDNCLTNYYNDESFRKCIHTGYNNCSEYWYQGGLYTFAIAVIHDDGGRAIGFDVYTYNNGKLRSLETLVNSGFMFTFPDDNQMAYTIKQTTDGYIKISPMGRSEFFTPSGRAYHSDFEVKEAVCSPKDNVVRIRLEEPLDADIPLHLVNGYDLDFETTNAGCLFSYQGLFETTNGSEVHGGIIFGGEGSTTPWDKDIEADGTVVTRYADMEGNSSNNRSRIVFTVSETAIYSIYVERSLWFRLWRDTSYKI